MAGKILELAGAAKKDEGIKKAKKILESGDALKRMYQIIYAQGGVRIKADSLSPGQYTFDYIAKKEGLFGKKRVPVESGVAGFVSRARVTFHP